VLKSNNLPISFCGRTQAEAYPSVHSGVNLDTRVRAPATE
jgi:hypothetical protein